MNVHIKSVHLKIKAHKCQDCNRKFSTKNRLASHVKQVHLKLKPLNFFVCNKCETTFEHKQHLQHHMNKVHLNVKPHECDLCEKSSFIKNQLKTHLKKSHKEETK